MMLLRIECLNGSSFRTPVHYCKILTGTNDLWIHYGSLNVWIPLDEIEVIANWETGNIIYLQ